MDRFPSSMYSVINRAKMAVVHFAEFFKGIVSGHIKFSNFENIRRRKFLRVSKKLSPPFFHHICGVMLHGAEKQMVGVYAMRDIAMVEDAEAGGNGAIFKDPRLSVRLDVCPRVGQMENPISFPVFAPRPKPASICFLNEGKESFIDGFCHCLRAAWLTSFVVILNHCRAILASFCQWTVYIFHVNIVHHRRSYGG